MLRFALLLALLASVPAADPQFVFNVTLIDKP